MKNKPMRFYAQCPDFPADDHAINTVAQIMDDLHLPNTAEGMAAAHAEAVRRGEYQPIRPETYLQQNNRQTPPPMLRTGNPEQQSNVDPQTMNMADLRRLAIQQQLSGDTQRR